MKKIEKQSIPNDETVMRLPPVILIKTFFVVQVKKISSK